MSQEKELKWKLQSKDDYRLLCGHLPDQGSETLQQNIYLDTNDWRLFERKIMMRIRIQDEVIILTVKGNATQDAGYFVAEEWECQLAQEEAAALLEHGTLSQQIASVLPDYFKTHIPGDGLRIIGKAQNRRKFYKEDDMIIEVDELQIAPDLYDYEVEIETTDPDRARRYLHRICRKYNIQCEPQTMTKYERFLKHHIR